MERIVTLILVISAVVSPAAVADPVVVTPSGVEIERLVDNSMDPPGIVGEFFMELVPPVACNGAVLFEGFGSLDVKTGVYFASTASFNVIANPGILIPNSGTTFQEAVYPICVGRQIIFLGDPDLTPSGIGRSVYVSTDGVITPLIEQGTVIGTSEIHTFTELDANEFSIAMMAALRHPSFAQVVVIMPHGEDPFIIADDISTVLPGQTEIATIYSVPLLVGRDLVFHARTQQSLGIYRWSEGRGLSVLVDTNTSVPASPGGNFGIFNLQFANLDEGIVFGAVYAGGFGLFIWDDGEIRPLILPGHVTEDGEVLTAARFPSGAGSLLSFTARTTDNFRDAIYVRTRDGKVKRILGRAETIEDMTVDFINAGADSTSVMIRITALDLDSTRPDVPYPVQHEVIYRVLFPDILAVPALSPAGIAALVLGLTFAGFCLLRRREEPCSKRDPPGG